MKISHRFHNYMSVVLPSDEQPISGEKSHDIMEEAVEVYRRSLLGGVTYAIEGEAGSMIGLLAFKDRSLLAMYTQGMDNPPAVITSVPLDDAGDFDWYLGTIGVRRDNLKELKPGEKPELGATVALPI